MWDGETLIISSSRSLNLDSSTPAPQAIWQATVRDQAKKLQPACLHRLSMIGKALHVSSYRVHIFTLACLHIYIYTLYIYTYIYTLQTVPPSLGGDKLKSTGPSKGRETHGKRVRAG